MRKNGYPLVYIAGLHNLTKGTVSLIIKNNKNPKNEEKLLL